MVRVFFCVFFLAIGQHAIADERIPLAERLAVQAERLQKQIQLNMCTSSASEVWRRITDASLSLNRVLSPIEFWDLTEQHDAPTSQLDVVQLSGSFRAIQEETEASAKLLDYWKARSDSVDSAFYSYTVTRLNDNGEISGSSGTTAVAGFGGENLFCAFFRSTPDEVGTRSVQILGCDGEGRLGLDSSVKVSGREILVDAVPFAEFVPAEDYHGVLSQLDPICLQCPEFLQAYPNACGESSRRGVIESAKLCVFESEVDFGGRKTIAAGGYACFYYFDTESLELLGFQEGLFGFDSDRVRRRTRPTRQLIVTKHLATESSGLIGSEMKFLESDGVEYLIKIQKFREGFEGLESLTQLLPDGTFVIDHVYDKKFSARAPEAGCSFRTLAAELALEEEASKPSLLLWFNLAMALVVAFIWIARRRGKRPGGSAVFVLFLSVLGCNRSEPSPANHQVSRATGPKPLLLNTNDSQIEKLTFRFEGKPAITSARTTCGCLKVSHISSRAGTEENTEVQLNATVSTAGKRPGNYEQHVFSKALTALATR